MANLPESCQLLISEAIFHGIATGLQQRIPSSTAEGPARAPGGNPVQPIPTATHRSRPVSPSLASEGSIVGETTQRDLDLLDDEDTPAPDLPPTFSGLFLSNLFKSLLRKAQATSKLGEGVATMEGSTAQTTEGGLFSEPLAEKEEIPAPQLFLDVVK